MSSRCTHAGSPQGFLTRRNLDVFRLVSVWLTNAIDRIVKEARSDPVLRPTGSWPGSNRERIGGVIAPLTITRRCRPVQGAFEQLTPAVVSAIGFVREARAIVPPGIAPVNALDRLFPEFPEGCREVIPDYSSELATRARFRFGGISGRGGPVDGKKSENHTSSGRRASIPASHFRTGDNRPFRHSPSGWARPGVGHPGSDRRVKSDCWRAPSSNDVRRREARNADRTTRTGPFRPAAAAASPGHPPLLISPRRSPARQPG